MAKAEEATLPSDTDGDGDGGAAFVLKGEGKWWHAGFHLTTAIVGPTVTALPYAMAGMGWPAGLLSLTVAGAVTFYSYLLLSKVLEHCESLGRRHIRFRELAADVFGSGWMFYFVVSVQAAVNMGVGVGCILLAAECLEIMYSNMVVNGAVKLYDFIAMVTVIMVILSQLPSFHSLRHVSLVSVLVSIAYSACLVAASAIAAHSLAAPPKNYSPRGSTPLLHMLNAFSSMSIIGTIFGNGILPEIQATLAAPARGKMLKALFMCYGVIAATFYPVAITGYWALGSATDANILKTLAPDEGPNLAPRWLLGATVILILLQLFAIALVYSQVAYDIMEKTSADVKRPVFSARNVLPRVAMRTAYVIVCGVVAAMLPFFGDVNALVGAIGFIPLDFILPMLLYNMALQPSRRSLVYWTNMGIMCVFTGVGVLGVVASVRQIALDAKHFHLFSSHAFD